LTVVLLFVSTCTFLKMQFPSILHHKTGYYYYYFLFTFHIKLNQCYVIPHQCHCVHPIINVNELVKVYIWYIFQIVASYRFEALLKYDTQFISYFVSLVSFFSWLCCLFNYASMISSL
jgi:hypothetical protein